MLEKDSFRNLIPGNDLALGILVAENIVLTPCGPLLEGKLQELLEKRKNGELTQEEEALRKHSRDLLRRGSYRPTGRSKPASEYLLREATAGQFPRINSAVDINNYLSLKFMVAISLWDQDLAQSTSYSFRLGQKGESYIFNSAGQELALEDLVLGAAGEKPIVTPVKDSLATKTTDKTKNIVMAIYYPLLAGSKDHLHQILEEAKGLFEEAKASAVELYIV